CARMADALRVSGIESARVVDLGCGPGVSTFELARRLPSARLAGVDVAPRMLAQARRRCRAAGLPSGRITWLNADAARLPLPAASVDACTGHSFLYLVANRRAVLAEVRRVLKPGGWLVLVEPHSRPATPRSVMRL